MGGTYAPDNVEVLTIPEHAEAHRLLWIFHGRPEDRMAWRFLSGQISLSEAALQAQRLGHKRSAETRRTPELRAKARASHLGKRHTDETRAKMSASQVGRKHTPEACAKIGAGHLGMKHTPETRAKISVAKRNPTPETRNKMRISHLGQSPSPEHRAKLSAAAVVDWARRKARINSHG